MLEYSEDISLNVPFFCSQTVYADIEVIKRELKAMNYKVILRKKLFYNIEVQGAYTDFSDIPYFHNYFN